MNILLDPLPEKVTVGGRAWPIKTEFFVWILFELTMQDNTITDTERVRQALALCYPTIPPNIEEALAALLWFYRCGAEAPTPGKGKSGGAPAKAYSFEQDADIIFAAFMACYHIDLSEADLHWWKFRALFRGLPQECELVKIMGYRTADLKGMGKTQRKLYEKMRKIYALQNPSSVESAVSLAERNRRMKDYVSQRFKEAGTD